MKKPNYLIELETVNIFYLTVQLYTSIKYMSNCNNTKASITIKKGPVVIQVNNQNDSNNIQCISNKQQ